jgi:hypothetical protein
MATPKKAIDLSRYLDIDGVRIDARRLNIALDQVPEQLKKEIMDGLDHIRRGFFKALYANTGLKDKRFIATKNVGIGRQMKVYRNPHGGNPLDMELGIFTRSKITAMHETGGTVRAKSGMMAIPVGSARSSTGRMSQDISEFQGMRRAFDPKSAKAKGMKLFMVVKNGKSLLMRDIGNGQVEAMFVLKNRMVIQPRLRMRDTWDREEGYRINVLNKSVETALQKTGLV